MSNIIKTIPLEEIISFYLEINESKNINILLNNMDLSLKIL